MAQDTTMFYASGLKFKLSDHKSLRRVGGLWSIIDFPCRLSCHDVAESIEEKSLISPSDALVNTVRHRVALLRCHRARVDNVISIIIVNHTVTTGTCIHQTSDSLILWQTLKHARKRRVGGGCLSRFVLLCKYSNTRVCARAYLTLTHTGT